VRAEVSPEYRGGKEISLRRYGFFQVGRGVVWRRVRALRAAEGDEAFVRGVSLVDAARITLRLSHVCLWRE
jgi:hypothetical protein